MTSTDSPHGSKLGNGDSIGGDKVAGNKIRVQNNYQTFIQPAARPGVTAADLRKRYGAAVRRNYCYFEFAGLSVKGATARVLGPNEAFHGLRFTSETTSNAGQYSKTLTTVGIAELQQKQTLVIVGPPGAGKSGTLRLLLDMIANTPELVPVYLPLRELVNVAAITYASIIECLVKQAHDELGIRDVTSDFFADALKSRSCVIAFDGLDELGDATQRQKTVLALRGLCTEYPGNRIFVTSRPDEYRESPIPNPSDKQPGAKFESFVLQPFGRDEITEYLQTCFDDDGSLATQILARSELTELAQGPLQLSFIAMVAQQGELPTDRINRIMLFDGFVKTALETWDKYKEIDPQQGQGRRNPTREELEALVTLRRSALEQIAWALRARTNNATALLENEALQTITDTKKTGLDITTASEILNWLTRRSGLIQATTQRGRSAVRTVYEFKHPQLREFLAGCYVARRLTANFDSAFTEVYPHLFNMAWREILHFTVGYLTREGTVHNRLLKAVLDTDAAYDELLHRRVLLAASLMANCDFVDPEIEQRIVSGLCKVASTNCCKARTAVELLLALPSGETAQSALKSLALADDWGQTLLQTLEKSPYPIDRDSCRVSAAIAVCQYGRDPERADAILEKVFPEVKSVYIQASLTRGWAILGDKERQKQVLMSALKTSDISDRSVWLSEMEAQGFAADAIQAQQSVFPTLERRARWECAEWLWERGALDGNSSELCSMFDDLTVQLQVENYPLPEYLWTAWQLSKRLEDVGKPHCAGDFIRAARLNRDSAWYTVDSWNEAEGDERQVALIKVATSDCDNSRRRGVVNRLLQDENNERAVPALLQLLRIGRTLRWTGTELVKGLVAKGHADKAASVLREVGTDPRNDFDMRATAAVLLHELDPEGSAKLLETSLVGVSQEEAADSIIKEFGELNRLSGPVAAMVLRRLSLNPSGMMILERVYSLAKPGSRLKNHAGVALFPQLAPDEALRRVSIENTSDPTIDTLILQFVQRGLCDLALMLIKKCTGEHSLAPFEGGERRRVRFLDGLSGIRNRTDVRPFLLWLLESDKTSNATKLAIAELLTEWGDLPTEYVIPTTMLECPEQYLNVDLGGGLDALFRLLDRLDRTEVAQEVFSALMTRGTEKPSLALWALENAGEIVPWRPEWCDLLARAIQNTEAEANVHCQLVAHLERRSQ